MQLKINIHFKILICFIPHFYLIIKYDNITVSNSLRYTSSILFVWMTDWWQQWQICKNSKLKGIWRHCCFTDGFTGDIMMWKYTSSWIYQFISTAENKRTCGENGNGNGMPGWIWTRALHYVACVFLPHSLFDTAQMLGLTHGSNCFGRKWFLCTHLWPMWLH